MSGDHDKYHGTAEVVKDGGVYLTAEEMHQIIGALEDAVYFLEPTDEDMQEKTGVYRVVTALENLKEKISHRKRSVKAKIRQFFECIIDAMDRSVEKRHAWIIKAAEKHIEAKLKKKNT